MDQSLRDSLRSLDWALEQSGVVLPQQEDEFTVQNFIDAAKAVDPSLSINSLRSRLQRMVAEGKLTSRKITLGGKQANVYKRVP